VRTKRTGAAAKAGHNLLFHVTSWEARLTVGPDDAGTSLELDVDATSLRVIEGSGGMQALGDDDKANIQKTIDDDVLKRRGITFRSTGVQAAADGRLGVQGDLTLLGTTRRLAFDVTVDGGTLAAVAVVKQSDWGMKPYSALFGALKVVDEVGVGVEAHLPDPQSL
jgi:polyisoprenoid-binding protein YceI